MSKKKILILDCGTPSIYMDTTGRLTHHMTDIAVSVLQSLGHDVVVTQVASNWDMFEEAEKIKKADVVIVQTPGWWMGPPWTFKKYQDEVFGQVAGTDGRHHDTPNDGYGTGGVLTDKMYMLSSTWNAPLTAFDRPGDFFDGRGIDGVFLPVHKAFQFIGMKPLPTYMYNDVVKNPDLKKNDGCWKEHLTKYFS